MCVCVLVEVRKREAGGGQFRIVAHSGACSGGVGCS